MDPSNWLDSNEKEKEKFVWRLRTAYKAEIEANGFECSTQGGTARDSLLDFLGCTSSLR